MSFSSRRYLGSKESSSLEVFRFLLREREQAIYCRTWTAIQLSTYYMMGIPLDLYTPIFAISRISGWTAHILEQYANNKLIRPRAEYIGPRNVPYVPIDER